MRYSGSPIPMGFGEASQGKSVCLADAGPGETRVRTLDVPVFQRLERVSGDWDAISGRLAELRLSGASAWLEVVLEGDGPDDGRIGGFREGVESALEGTSMELLCLRDMARVRCALSGLPGGEGAGLDALTSEDVFEMLMDAEDVHESRREDLRLTYREALRIVGQEGEGYEDS